MQVETPAGIGVVIASGWLAGVPVYVVAVPGGITIIPAADPVNPPVPIDDGPVRM